MDTALQQTLNKKQYFIFDMDGTLVDLEELNHKGYAVTVEEFFALTLTNEDYQKYFSGTRTAEAFHGFLQSKKVGEYDVDELIRHFRSIKRDKLINTPEEVVSLKKGAKKYLEYLQGRDFAVCLATSTVPEFVTAITRHFDIDRLFDLTLTADDVTIGKPDPQIYNTAIEKLQASKEAAIVFEDSKNGIESAKNAGIVCVGIHTRGLNDEYVHNADYVIEDFLSLIT